jgi:Mn2+/Fe2+ NRAMP family transporter
MKFLRNWWIRLSLLFTIIGPGIISGTADNDAGGITTYSVVGAHFGYQMLWLLPLVGALLWLTQDMGARLGFTTGKGLAALIRENFSIKMTFFVIIATTVINWTVIVAEFAGIASVAHLYNLPRGITVLCAAAIISFIIIKGNFQIVQRVFLTSSMLYIGYLIAGLEARPDWSAVAFGTLVPHFPSDTRFLYTSVALVGTTVTAWGQFFVQSYYVDKGSKAHNMRLIRWDITAGTVWCVAVAFFIMVAAASTLYLRGIPVEDAAQAALALEPFAGEFAKHLFAWGLLNASLLGAGVVTISTSYMVTEAFGWERKVDLGMKESPEFYRLLVAALFTAALFVLIPHLPLIATIVFPQALNTFLLPVIFISMYLLLNRKDVMGDQVNTFHYNVVSLIAIVSVIGLNGVYFYSLIEKFLKLL